MSDILVVEQSTPSTPSTGQVKIYPKTDGLMYSLDDAGTETLMSSGATSGITLGTPQASTSGTSIDFTSIPTGTKRVVINFEGVSTSGTSNPLIQIGNGSTPETSGYLGASAALVDSASVAATNYTTGFGIRLAFATNVFQGSVVISLLNSSSNLWVASGIISLSSAAASVTTSGSKTISGGALNIVRITTVGGSDTFDAGSINISYE